MSAAENRWIISSHRFKEHLSIEAMERELARLKAGAPGKDFRPYRIKRTVRPDPVPAVIGEAKGRWHSVIVYRTDTGTVDVEHFYEEIGDLHDLVEHGPHWDTIVSITTTRINHVDAADLTVELAAQL